MTKEQIANRYFGTAKEVGHTQFHAGLRAMEEYAKLVLDFILAASENGIGGDPSLRIEMVGRNFFYEADKEGDQELDSERIIKLYEKYNQLTT